MKISRDGVVPRRMGDKRFGEKVEKAESNQQGSRAQTSLLTACVCVYAPVLL